jgi:hypothetical protein
MYMKITQLFWDVSLRTKMGQMMDLVSQPQGEYLLPHAPKSSHFFRYSTN